MKYNIVVSFGTEAGNEHYSHIVIDILKGTCEIIMDPHADAQMDCIIIEFSKNFIFAFGRSLVPLKFYYSAMQQISDKWL